MGRYIARRMLQFIPVFFGATFLIFALVFAIPGDPIRALAGEKVLSETVLNTLNERYRRHEEEILLSAGSEQELIFRPSSFYRLASQRGDANLPQDRAVVYAR